MEIKGMAVNAMREFVLTNFKPRYDEWINSLPDESRKIIGSVTLAHKWYPMREALIEPLGKVCKLFYNNDKKNGAWQFGRFFVDHDMKKIFKLLFIMGPPSPAFTLKRAPSIFKTYFNPAEMKLIENSPGKGILQIVEFPDPQEIVEFLIAGWIEHICEMIGSKSTGLTITKSMTKGNPVTEYVMTWEVK